MSTGNIRHLQAGKPSPDSGFPEKPDYTGLYRQFKKGILAIRLSPGSGLCRAADSFSLALSYWYRVKQMAEGDDFCSPQAAIRFFKEIKPGFTSVIELSVMQYSGHLFEPAGDDRAAAGYWENEKAKAVHFLLRHHEFRDYYFSGRNSKDELYFTRHTRGKRWGGAGKSYPDSLGTCSSHDHLACMVRAYSGYIPYAGLQAWNYRNQKCRHKPALIPLFSNQQTTIQFGLHTAS